jgi:hypothetical protein
VNASPRPLDEQSATLIASGETRQRLVERVPFGRAPNPPLSSSERLERWRRAYNALSVEQQFGIEEGKTTKQEFEYK